MHILVYKSIYFRKKILNLFLSSIFFKNGSIILYFCLLHFLNDKKEYVKRKFKNITVFEKKTELPVKPKYLENCENSDTFFSWYFPKIKYSTNPRKKNWLFWHKNPDKNVKKDKNGQKFDIRISKINFLTYKSVLFEVREFRGSFREISGFEKFRGSKNFGVRKIFGV